MEPNSANENAPKIESMAPTIHAAKTMETLRPSCAISAGLRKMPVPIIVPTTIAPEAQAPKPRTSSSRFSVMFPRLVSRPCLVVLHFPGRRPKTTPWRPDNLELNAERGESAE